MAKQTLNILFPASPNGGSVAITLDIPDPVISVPAPVVTQAPATFTQGQATESHTVTLTPPVVTPPTPIVRKNLILNVDFSKGVMPATSVLNAQPASRFIIKTLANGKKYCEVTVAKSDPVIPATTGSNRSEFNVPTTQAEPFQEGAERWYGVRFNLPTSFIADTAMELLYQLHEFSGTASPHFALWTQAGRWRTAIDGVADLDMGAYEFDKDTDYVFHIKWSTGIAGIIDIWKDGVKQSKVYKGANVPLDTKLPYMKSGIYKWNWKRGPASNPSSIIIRTINIGCLYIGNELATYNDVAP